MARSKAAAKGEGFVTPAFAQGALIVEDASGRLTRLSWEDAAPGDKRRALPAGEYALRTYRLIRKDSSGTEWILSATANPVKTISVRPGQETRVALDEGILLKSGLKQAHGTLNLAMEFKGDQGSGLTIYASGKRIPVRYRVVDPAGKEIAAGSMTYG